MKKILFGVILALLSILVYKSCDDNRQEKQRLRENSMLIQQELQNVSKLIVTEGNFVEVYSYADSKEMFGSLLTADKKALVVVNAEALISYDLSKIEYELDETNKTIHIRSIPEPEIKINPDFEYYDVTSDYFNPFNASDYNAIKNRVNESLKKKVERSSLRSNAKNRLLSELSKILILANSYGWTVAHQEKAVIETSTFLD